MKRLGFVLFLCVLIVGVSFFLSREREVARRSPQAQDRAADALSAQPARGAGAVSGIAKGSAGVSAADASPADQAKARMLDEILVSKNDNDPRLDREFNGLGEGVKALLRERYARFAPEKRNERGTIVFLLGRNITTDADVAFLHGVLGEPPCLSLADCSKDSSGQVDPANEHLEIGGEVTLAYPQLVALLALERYLASQSQDPSLTASALRELAAARRSPIAKVAGMADQILRHYSARR